jgi:molybdopterin molybdotransferase
MISEEEARSKIFEAVPRLPMTSVSLADALDCFAAEEARASVPIPAFDNSAMDGYAVIATSATKGARLRIVGEQPAGVSRDLKIAAGEAVRIFTGAPMPTGADAVVMQEETERDGDFVVIRAEKIALGEFVRKAGADLAAGQLIIQRGQRLTAAGLALIAAQGVASVKVHQRARVAVVTTGDEIRPAGAKLRPGEIFESNAVMLTALAKHTGCELRLQAHCRDNFDELCSTLRQAVETDTIVINGGVSVGERDLVRAALKEIGATIDLWRVAVKPGKPFLFGKHESCAIFGLPGNPVSSFVTFYVFVRPALLRMMGANDAALAPLRGFAKMGCDVSNSDGIRPHYLRGRLADGTFTSVGRQESHALFGLARANVLLRLDAGQRVAAGEWHEVLLLD